MQLIMIFLSSFENSNQSLENDSKPDYRDFVVIELAVRECSTKIQLLLDVLGGQKRQYKEYLQDAKEYIKKASNAYIKGAGSNHYLSEKGVINQFKDFVETSKKIFQLRQTIENRDLIDL